MKFSRNQIIIIEPINYFLANLALKLIIDTIFLTQNCIADNQQLAGGFKPRSIGIINPDQPD
jgi:hypothetical protein